jgi:hypothetical protein
VRVSEERWKLQSVPMLYNALDLRVVCDVYWAGIQDSYTCC